MSPSDAPPARQPADAGPTASDASPDDPDSRQAALRQHQRERLARLFRHAGDNADMRYLLGLMARYRGVDLP